MIKPKQVIIEVTNRCNLTCRYCPSAGTDRGKAGIGDMSLELFKSIVDRIDFDTTVIPWMNGEPFLHPDYLEMLQYLDKASLPYYITTNLTIWRQDIIDHLLSDKSRCYQIIISMDGMPGTGNISKCRPGTIEDSLLINLSNLLGQKMFKKSKKDIAVKICERGQDYSEIEDYVKKYVHVDGIDYVCVGKPLATINEESMRTAPCQYPDNNFMVIRHDGTLVLCAYHQEVANNLVGSYGKLNLTTPLLDYYNNYSITKFRNDQNRGIYPHPCDKCGFAYTGKGYTGAIRFRGEEEKIYYHEDYYNKFFSKKNKQKDDKYYDTLSE
jgi:MoaA/NifB/PqqE/SkfB family radical SAM enzyme